MIIHYYYGNVYNNRGGITEMNNRIPAGRHADPIPEFIVFRMRCRTAQHHGTI